MELYDQLTENKDRHLNKRDFINTAELIMNNNKYSIPTLPVIRIWEKYLYSKFKLIL